MLGTEAGSGEWTRLCTHRPHDCIDQSKVQARDEVNVEFRLLAHHAELAFPGAGQASHRALGAAAWGLQRSLPCRSRSLPPHPSSAPSPTPTSSALS